MNLKNLPTLRPGADAPVDVLTYLRSILNSQGFPCKPVGPYNDELEKVVVHFQSTHIGKNGKMLVVDSEVGPQTWWALLNPSGAAQRSGLQGDIPEGLSKPRIAVLRAALADHAKGVAEVPDGANFGDGVSRYLQGIGPAPWCCHALSTWFKDGTGEYPFGERFGLVAALWNKAKSQGRTYTADKPPVPGDAMVILYRNAAGKLTGQGHIGLVAATAVAGDKFNAVEGNAGNRVKLTLRSDATEYLAGFVDLFGDSAALRGSFSRGLLGKASAAGAGAAATR